MININFKWAAIVTIIVSIIIFTCLMVSDASANSYVEVEAESDGGYFSFTGDGGYWDWYIGVTGFDRADVDVTNHWDYARSSITYKDVGDGTINVRIKDRSHNDKWMYYDWGSIPIDGNGIYVPPYGGGGRYVNVTGSPNVTGEIECIVDIRKAVFQFDTRHSEADLTVFVHNGELLENATVSLINGNPTVKWTDENGEAKFTPGTGNYHILVEHENFSAMLVDDLRIEADKSYYISVNMTDCLTSKGVAVCSPDADDLVVYYRDKEPAMGTISPQGFVDYFADRLRTCKGIEDNCADGTLERMATQWGIYPTELNVLLYDCNFTDMGCQDGMRDWEITYVVKNYQQYACVYTVTLVAGNNTMELGSDELPATWSSQAKTTTTSSVMIEGCDNHKMYLLVTSERAND